LLSPRDAARLYAAGREARLRPGSHAQSRRRRGLRRAAAHSVLDRRGDRVAQPVLGSQRRDGARGGALGGRHRASQSGMRAGAPETIRFLTWQMAQTSGAARRFKELAEQCLAEYNLDGWTAPDLITPRDVNRFLQKDPCPRPQRRFSTFSNFSAFSGLSDFSV